MADWAGAPKQRSWWSAPVGGEPLWFVILVLPVLLAVICFGFASLLQRDAPAKIAMFIGDSYAVGAGVENLSGRWTTIVSRDAGWLEDNVAMGGTGYVSTAGKSGCGLDYCASYEGVLNEVAGTVRPDIVVISGGRNDLNKLANFRERTNHFFSSLRESFPHSALYVISPIWDDDPPPPELNQVQRDIRDAAEAVGAVYLDIGEPLEGRPSYISEDGIHPNKDGYAAIAGAVETCLRRSGVDF
jgi:acyl-CoA thioesterase-1